MEKVLYIHPSKFIDESKYAYMPMGIFSIMSVLKNNGFEIKLINYPMEYAKNRGFNLIDKIEEFNPKYILMDLHWYEHSFGTIELAKIIKKSFKSIKIIVGGITASIFSSQILNFSEDIDYIVSGEGDYSIYELIKAIEENENIENISGIYYRSNYRVLHTKLNQKCINIDNLDYLTSIEYLESCNDYFMIDIHGKLNQNTYNKFWVQIAKGCIFNCKYCGGANDVQSDIFGRGRIQIKSIEKISNEIKVLHEKHNIKQLMLSHDISNFGFKYVKDFMEIVKKYNLGVYLEFFQLPSPEILEYILKNSNIEKSLFALTPLVGDEKIRKIYGKTFNNKRLMNVLDILNKYKCNIDVYFTPNLKDESMDDFNKTIYLIQNIRTNNKCKIFMQPITLEPKSRLAIENNCDLKFEDYYNYCINRNRNELKQLNLDSNYYKKMIIWNLFKEKSGGEENAYY